MTKEQQLQIFRLLKSIENTLNVEYQAKRHYAMEDRIGEYLRDNNITNKYFDVKTILARYFCWAIHE